MNIQFKVPLQVADSWVRTVSIFCFDHWKSEADDSKQQKNKIWMLCCDVILRRKKDKAMQRERMIASIGTVLGLFSLVHGHGYVSSPRSRNWLAHELGTDGQEIGKAKREYCPHCLNRNNGVCGYTSTNDYDEWVDSMGNIIPWDSQGEYKSGDVIRISFTITAHHGGHIEVRACPKGRQSTWDCFQDSSRSLRFVRDVSYDSPVDPVHPERGYLAGWRDGYRDFVYDFKLPNDLYGEEILLQWRYITSNSCKPPGYDAYFNGGNSQSKVLPSTWYSPNVNDCDLPYPQSGDPSAPSSPEQFFGCIEGRVECSVFASTKHMHLTVFHCSLGIDSLARRKPGRSDRVTGKGAGLFADYQAHRR